MRGNEEGKQMLFRAYCHFLFLLLIIKPIMVWHVGGWHVNEDGEQMICAQSWFSLLKKLVSFVVILVYMNREWQFYENKSVTISLIVPNPMLNFGKLHGSSLWFVRNYICHPWNFHIARMIPNKEKNNTDSPSCWRTLNVTIKGPHVRCTWGQNSHLILSY